MRLALQLEKHQLGRKPESHLLPSFIARQQSAGRRVQVLILHPALLIQSHRKVPLPPARVDRSGMTPSKVSLFNEHGRRSCCKPIFILGCAIRPRHGDYANYGEVEAQRNESGIHTHPWITLAQDQKRNYNNCADNSGEYPGPAHLF